MKSNDYDCFPNKNTKWSKDWENFDWEIVRENLENAEKHFGDDIGIKEYDIGITVEQFKEFLQWFRENEPEEYNKLLLYIVLKEKGMEKRDIDFCLSHPGTLERALDILLNED